MKKSDEIRGIFEELNKAIEEGRVVLPEFGSFVEEFTSYRWEATRTEIDPKAAPLEARAGEDGIYRVERETDSAEETDLK